MSSEQKRRQEGQAAYSAARTGLFNMKAEDVGIAAPPDGPDVWGVVIDYPLTQMTCTLAILADGTWVNLFLSEGPLIVGAGQHREVARAAKKVLDNAQSLHSSLQPTTDFSVPNNDRQRVYLWTATGVLGEEVLRHGASERQRRLAEMVRQGDAVITTIRKRYQSLDAIFNVKDNLLQAKIIAGSFAMCAVAGAIAAPVSRSEIPFWGGAIMGGLAGLILGFLGSGVLLMVMRAKRP